MPERAPIWSWWEAMRTFPQLSETWKHHVLRYMQIPACSVPGKTVLDVCCGTGYGSVGLFQRGYKVSAFDKWPGFAVLAKQLGIGFYETDLMQFEGGPFDVVCAFECLEHLDGELPVAVARMTAWCKAGGMIYASVPIRHPDRVWHRHYFDSPDEVRKIWGDSLAVVHHNPDISLWVLKKR